MNTGHRYLRACEICGEVFNRDDMVYRYLLLTCKDCDPNKPKPRKKAQEA
jgi:translation initiation factor 2 beta subunit (eIF-2beta)/eIF-5